jgi:DNA-directed RNA polymerase subunit F
MAVANFKNLVRGMESFYQEKLDSIINSQTSQYDFERLVQTRDFEMLVDIIELVMGVVVNCEDKQEHIEKILELEPTAQEDLQKMIERSL